MHFESHSQAKQKSSYPPHSVFVLSKYIWDKISRITKSVMKFFVFLEKWIYFQNKNILFRYKNLLNDLFHNIFWLQKVYQKCITKVKKEPEPPYFRGIRAKIVLLKLDISNYILCLAEL